MDTLLQFTTDEGFLGRYQQLVIDIVIPYQEKALRDEIEGAEKSHAIENFRMAAQMLETGHCDGEFYGMVFQDSDVAKWLEAVAYSLRIKPDAELMKRADEVIALIGRAQHADGYLNTYFTVKEPARRWTNLEEAHELYCAGHMIEAAVAYAACTGKTELLKIMCKMADHMYEHFVAQDTEGFPGHPEVELALMRLYHYSGEKRYMELAKRFVDERGTDYFIREAQLYPWQVWSRNGSNREYTQTNAPVREQKDAVGHAVRAVYLYSGMADLAKDANDSTLFEACKTLWESVTQRRMYLTGAIGSAYEGEAFTKDYHLPNDTAYAETCASVGLMFFAQRMLRLEKRGEYADVMERALYNTVLAGMQLDGKRFFYVNPLETIPGISGEAVTHRHVLPQRPSWFACACCPPNVARLLTSIGAYAWSVEKKTAYSHLFIAGKLDMSDALGGAVSLKTNYPSGNELRYHFAPAGDAMDITLAVRIPAWSANTAITLGGKPIAYELKDGYAYISGSFTAADELLITLDMAARRVYASSRISANSGKVAFTRGPIVYCAEGVDNGGNVIDIVISKASQITEHAGDQFAGMPGLSIKGERLTDDGSLYSFTPPTAEPCDVTLVPYFAWGNRGLSSMRIWMPEA